jgi:hypothetical protein
MITDDELREIGLAYGSEREYRAAMRELGQSLFKGRSLGRTSVYFGNSARSDLPYPNTPIIKRINIVGKVITSKDVAASGRQVLVILSPSKSKKGYTIIPTGYGRNDFNSFVKSTEREGKVLYINDSTPAGGQLQLLPRPVQDTSKPSVVLKSDLVKNVSKALDENGESLDKEKPAKKNYFAKPIQLATARSLPAKNLCIGLFITNGMPSFLKTSVEDPPPSIFSAVCAPSFFNIDAVSASVAPILDNCRPSITSRNIMLSLIPAALLGCRAFVIKALFVTIPFFNIIRKPPTAFIIFA